MWSCANAPTRKSTVRGPKPAAAASPAGTTRATGTTCSSGTGLSLCAGQGRRSQLDTVQPRERSLAAVIRHITASAEHAERPGEGRDRPVQGARPARQDVATVPGPRCRGRTTRAGQGSGADQRADAAADQPRGDARRPGGLQGTRRRAQATALHGHRLDGGGRGEVVGVPARAAGHRLLRARRQDRPPGQDADRPTDAGPGPRTCSPTRCSPLRTRPAR